MSFLDVLFCSLNYKRTKNLFPGERAIGLNVTSKVALVSHPKGLKMFKIRCLSSLAAEPIRV